MDSNYYAIPKPWKDEEDENRDYWRYQFAGMAMQGILAGNTDAICLPVMDKDGLVNGVASASIALADALLKELDKWKEEAGE